MNGPSLDDAFWGNVVVNPDSGCWEWVGGKTMGYGSLWTGTRNETAHRVAYRMFVGDIAEGNSVYHSCHTSDPDCAGGPSCPHRACVNPDHLYQAGLSEASAAAAAARLTQ